MHIEIPVTLFTEIATDKVAVANARIRDIKLGRQTKYRWPSRYHGDDSKGCHENLQYKGLAASAHAAADIASADADFALALADAAEDAARIMRANNPLPYSTEVNAYIPQPR
jgi:hypothetical protein